MDSMKCYSCVMKHLSAALSFGKEVLSGHSKGDELDHRIDFLGEITNAEQHLELIDKSLFEEISQYRKNIQEKDVLLEASDLDFIREMYLKVERLKDGVDLNYKTPDFIIDTPDLVYLNVTNKDFFDLSYKLTSKHLLNHGKIYVLKSSVDLSQYTDIEVLDEDLKGFMKRDGISTDVIVFNENMAVLREFDARKIYPSYSPKILDYKQIIKEVKQQSERKLYLYDEIKPQPVNVENFNEIIGDDNYSYYLTPYFYYSNQTGRNDLQATVYADRPICCSTRGALRTKTFVRWNESAFESLKKELSIQ